MNVFWGVGAVIEATVGGVEVTLDVALTPAPRGLAVSLTLQPFDHQGRCNPRMR